ncbi:hypothetical protein N7474_007642 [Penicillium riverlandense]|uniref:uncharacterized protein n=1 Tax=Penicillium riverlandense TaxID=1903569 RepID=UPI0025491C74|nr:uncharacterized protein N7474_007642 [Penicillium riverlandense]KAJ5811341.1 hypothetical protein N7474_007642 [Penicillium riverlandense]
MSKRYQVNELSTAWDSQANRLYQAALEQYGKSVACFRSQLGANLESNPRSLEIAPACCVLLVMFEFMQGNADGLLLHLRNATKLAASVSTSPQTQSFVYLLTLIDMVAATWLNLDRSYSDASLHLPKLDTSQMPLPCPSNLETLCYDLTNIKNDVMTWRHAVASAHRDTTVDLDSFTTVRSQNIQSRLDAWYQEFITVPSNEEDIATPRRSLLRANYLHTMLVVDAVHHQQLSAQPIRADSANGQDLSQLKSFYEIIELAEAVLEAGYCFSRYDASAGEESLEATGLLPLFSFRHSFIQPLFYVAQYAPSMFLRQRAIQLLLGKPWREGAWDSFIMGSIAKRSLDASILA